MENKNKCYKNCNKKCECKCEVNVNLNDGNTVYIDGPGTLHIEFLDKGTLQLDYDELLQDNHSYRIKTKEGIFIAPFTSIKYMHLF